MITSSSLEIKEDDMKKWGFNIIIVNIVDILLLESFFVITDMLLFKKFSNGCFMARLFCNIEECKIAFQSGIA